jgi:hypothetical protein
MILDREFCKDGVLYISLKGWTDFETLVKAHFKKTMYALVDEEAQRYLEQNINGETQDLYHWCLYVIKDYDILIALDDWDDFMLHNENLFKNLIKDILQKVPDSKVLISSQKAVNIAEELGIAQYTLKKLSNNHIFKLMCPPNKTIAEFSKEITELWEKTDCWVKENGKFNVLTHKLFDILNGNPLWCLLVSSNAMSKLFNIITIDKSMLKIYSKLEALKLKYKSWAHNYISYILAIQMSLEYIEEENPEIIQVLNHLSYCPSGLSSRHIKSLCKDWDKWVGLLKDRSLINETIVYETTYNMQNDSPTQGRETFNNYASRKGFCDSEYTTKLFTVTPWLATFIEESISPDKKKEYDEKVVSFIVETLKELLSTSNFSLN